MQCLAAADKNKLCDACIISYLLLNTLIRLLLIRLLSTLIFLTSHVFKSNCWLARSFLLEHDSLHVFFSLYCLCTIMKEPRG